MHHRMRPQIHRFTYRVFSLMIDLDRLDEAGKITPLFRVNRPGIVSFLEGDHLEPGFDTLRDQVNHKFALAGLPKADRIVLVCYPRIFGFVFNPLSMIYAYDEQNELIGLIYQVRNTFGGRHDYVCPVDASEVTPAGIRQSCDKVFHVSPFLAMNMRYHFRMVAPGQSVRWRILESDPEGPILAAVFSGERLALSTSTLSRLLLKLPFVTLKIYAAIHWQAFRLWLKGVPFLGMTPKQTKK